MPNRPGTFKKGDPRINRNGRPKSFDALRKLAQQLSHEVAIDADGNELIRGGHKVTVAELVLSQMVRDPKQRKEFLEIAFGKVPTDVNIGGETKVKVENENLDRTMSTLAETLGEIISGQGTEPDGEVDTTE